MKMSVKYHLFWNVLNIYVFIFNVIEVSTQNLDVTVEIDGNVEQLNLESDDNQPHEENLNEKLNAEAEGGDANMLSKEIVIEKKTNEEDGGNGPPTEEDDEKKKSKEADDAVEKLNDVDDANEKSEGDHTVDKLNDVNDANEKLDDGDGENDLNKEINTRDVETEPLSLKNNNVPKLEPGFDLTPEEMQKFKIWKDGVIPYYIDVVSFSDKVIRDSIRSFLRMINDATGLNFEELPSPPSNDNERWVFFINRRGLLGCADHTVKNFTNQGVQQVVLGYDCFATKGELAEAVMSIVGVPAQHNTPDRDKYIKVNTENIMPDKKHLFEKLNDNEWLFHDLKYDFDSVTHYDIHKYSVNGRATIEYKKNTPVSVNYKMSPTDFLKIKMLYNFITKNRKLQVPECEKLFKPRRSSKYEKFVPKDDFVAKPRKKPNRYLGLANDESTHRSTENNEHGKENAGEGEETEIEEPAGENNENTEHEGYNVENEKSKEYDLQKEEVTGNLKLNDVQDNPDFQKTLSKKLDPLSLLSDYESREGRVQLKGYKGKSKVDPLLLLSDYETDER